VNSICRGVCYYARAYRTTLLAIFVNKRLV